MKPGTVGAGLVFTLVANPLIGAFRTAMECPTPTCFELNAEVPPDESHIPDSNSADEYAGGTLAFTGNNNSGGTITFTGAMNSYQNLVVGQVVNVRSTKG